MIRCRMVFVCLAVGAGFLFAADNTPSQQQQPQPQPTPPGRRVSIETLEGSGLRVVDGDILLPGQREASIGAKLWPSGKVPYEVAPNFRDQNCLQEAIREWNTRTPVRLSPRASEGDYLVFTPAPRSLSAVGLAGGRQPVFIGESECQFGGYRTFVHEIGHAVGLFHEHQRPDRDRFIRTLPENFFVAPTQQDLISFLGSPMGLYDYASVMHYGPLGGSPSGLAAIETIPRGIPTGLDVGVANMLSPGDLDAVQRLYGEAPSLTTISTNPAGLDVIVDGQRRTAPFTVNWAAGSQHSVDVPSPQTREGARYEFARWNDDGRQQHTVTAGNATHLAANFAAYVRLRGLPGDPSRGTVTLDSPTGEAPPADGLRLIGTPVRARAQGAPGFFLSAWESGRGSRNPLVFPVFHPDPSVNEFVARFAPYPTTTIVSQPSGITIRVNGVLAVTPAQFRWEPGTLQTVDFPREVVSETTRYRAQVFRTDTPIQDGKLVATPFDATVTGIYLTDYRLRVSALPAGSGEVTLSPALPDGFVAAGERVQLTARPSAGSRFVRWRGSFAATGASEENPVSVAVNSPLDIVAEFAPAGQPAPGQSSVRNAASGLPGAIAPGEIVSIFLAGGGLPDLAFGAFSEGKLASEVAGVRVLINGIAAPIVAVAPGQVNAIAPYSLTAGSRARIEIQRDGQAVGDAAMVDVIEAAPALFTANSSGFGQAAALNQDGSFNTTSQPAASGEVIVLFGTGDGSLDPAPGEDGLISAVPLPKPRLPIAVEIGGKPARVLYAGPAPGSVFGLFQVNAEVPTGLTAGNAAVHVSVGPQRSSAGVTVAIR